MQVGAEFVDIDVIAFFSGYFQLFKTIKKMIQSVKKFSILGLELVIKLHHLTLSPFVGKNADGQYHCTHPKCDSGQPGYITKTKNQHHARSTDVNQNAGRFIDNL